MHSSLLVASLVAAAASASPLAATILNPSCAPVSTAVNILRAYSAASSFCSSFLPITTRSTSITSISTASAFSTTSVVTGTNVITASPVTSTLPVETITAPTSTVTVTGDPTTITLETSTITADPSTVFSTEIVTTTTNIVGGAKRDVKRASRRAVKSTSTSSTKKTSTSTTAKASTTSSRVSTSPTSSKKTTSITSNTSTRAKTVPTQLASLASSVLSSACNCLSLPTPTSTLVILQTTTQTVVQTANIADSTTAVPTVFETPLTTSTPLSSVTEIPTSTESPVTTITPVTTELTTQTTTITTSVPTVVLASPTPIFDNTEDLDDPWTYITVPFPLQAYGISSTTIGVSVNGWISLSSDAGNQYSNTQLPTNALPDTAIAPYWDDLFIYQATPQGVYYQVSGTAPDRSIAFEWYTSHYQDASQYYHFSLTMREASPGVPEFAYYQILDHGASATVGMQSRRAGGVAQYSCNRPVVADGMQVRYNAGSDAFERV